MPRLFAGSATNDGVGLPAHPADLQAGIGTSIDDGLALRLGATLQPASADSETWSQSSEPETIAFYG